MTNSKFFIFILPKVVIVKQEKLTSKQIEALKNKDQILSELKTKLKKIKTG